METETLKEQTPVKETGCCPPFDPTPWHDRMLTWDEKMFIKDSVKTFYYMPMNFGKVMRRLSLKVESAGADVPEWLCLSDHTSKWNMDVYLEVDKIVPDASNVKLSGNFYCRVYEGPFKDTGKWGEDYKNAVAAKGLKTGKLYMWYTTCPKCAKAYGKNYTVFVGEIIG